MILLIIFTKCHGRSFALRHTRPRRRHVPPARQRRHEARHFQDALITTLLMTHLPAQRFRGAELAAYYYFMACCAIFSPMIHIFDGRASFFIGRNAESIFYRRITASHRAILPLEISRLSSSMESIDDYRLPLPHGAFQRHCLAAAFISRCLLLQLTPQSAYSQLHRLHTSIILRQFRLFNAAELWDERAVAYALTRHSSGARYVAVKNAT